MNTFQIKLSTAIATATLVTFAAAPLVFADTATDISANGAFTNNAVQQAQAAVTTVSQSNNTAINNTVDTKQNTGGNEANFNTGGSVTVVTGNANADVQVNNAAGMNQANVNGASNPSATTLVTGNGAFSQNTASANNTSATNVSQTNTTQVSNSVTTDQNTGANKANYNTGTDVVIATGNANAGTSINNQANTNYATVFNGVGSNDSVAAIAGNGAFSNSNVNVSGGSSTSLAQDNSAWISNYVHNTQNTGKNNASYNTGGTVVIGTGDTNALVNLTNSAGANQAVVTGGGSYNTLFSDILGNGAFSNNNVTSTNSNTTALSQSNTTGITNDVVSKQNTGHDQANFGTGGFTWISSGNANDYTNLWNQAGSNNAVVGGTMWGGNGFVNISGNGAFSDNSVNSANNADMHVWMSNLTQLNNSVHKSQTTGDNKSAYMTVGYYLNYLYDGGSTQLWSGDAQSWTNIMNNAGYNSVLSI